MHSKPAATGLIISPGTANPALEPTASSFGSAALRLRFRRRLTASVRLPLCGVGRKERVMQCSSFQPEGGVLIFVPLAMLLLTLASGILVVPLSSDAQRPL